MSNCPHCGAFVAPSVAECPSCGTAIDGTVPPPGPPLSPPTADGPAAWFAIESNDVFDPEPTEARRRPGRLIAAGAGALAIVVVAGLAWQGLRGHGAGADSPEGAVRGLCERDGTTPMPPVRSR